MKNQTAAQALPPSDLLPVGRHASTLFRFLRVVLTPLIRALFRVRIAGTEHIPGDGPFVIAANHLGWLDSFLILMAFPSEPHVHFLGAVRGLVARPLQWRLVRTVGGYIPVDMDRRSDPGLFRHVERCLAAGGAAAFYPEACYGTAGELQPFRKGFAHFAVGMGVPVLPVALGGTDRLWLRREVGVVIGKPISGDDVDELVGETRRVLTEMLPPPGELPSRRFLEAGLTNLF